MIVAAEEGRGAEADLDAQQALPGPVDVVELEQQRGLVEGHPDPEAERKSEDRLELAALAHQSGPAGAKGDQDSGDEMVHVTPADLDVRRVGHQPPRMPAGREPHEREAGAEAGRAC